MVVRWLTLQEYLRLSLFDIMGRYEPAGTMPAQVIVHTTCAFGAEPVFSLAHETAHWIEGADHRHLRNYGLDLPLTHVTDYRQCDRELEVLRRHVGILDHVHANIQPAGLDERERLYRLEGVARDVAARRDQLFNGTAGALQTALHG